MMMNSHVHVCYALLYEFCYHLLQIIIEMEQEERFLNDVNKLVNLLIDLL